MSIQQLYLRGYGASFKWYGDRAINFGGDNAPYEEIIDYWSLSNQSNASDFGDPYYDRGLAATASNETRGVFGGGRGPEFYGGIDYVTIASTGNASNFGNMTYSVGNNGGCGSKIGRGVFVGGDPDSTSMQYVDIATTGNATNAGDLDVGRDGCFSTTNGSRGLWAGGNTPSSEGTISYSNLASTANAQDFGDMLYDCFMGNNGSVSAGDRGVFAGGLEDGDEHIQYVNIASLGNAANFGDLIASRYQLSGTSNNSLGAFAGGGGNHNQIQYIAIASTGNASDGGDLSVGRSRCSATSGN